MNDINGAEATVEYYVVYIYRRRRGKKGEEPYLAGVVEDTEGRRQAFVDCRGLWEELAGRLGRG